MTAPAPCFSNVCNCHEGAAIPRACTCLLQVAFHDLVLSLDGEGGWAVYRGKRAAERDGEGDDASSYADVAMSSSAPSGEGEQLLP